MNKFKRESSTKRLASDLESDSARDRIRKAYNEYGSEYEMQVMSDNNGSGA